MNNASFSDEQIAQMHRWMNELHSIGELQSKIQATFAKRLTYLETRFLMDDLHLQFPQPAEAKPNKPSAAPLEGSLVDAGKGSVTVSLDPVTRPGMLVNGSVTFSDGQKATWGLDQLGRVALQPETSGYRPSDNDRIEFQSALQKQLSEMSTRGSL